MKSSHPLVEYRRHLDKIKSLVKTGRWYLLSLDRRNWFVKKLESLADILRKSGHKIASAAGLGALLVTPTKSDAQFIPIEIMDLSFELCDHTNGISTNDRAATGLVDLDGDGDLDLVLNDVVYDDGEEEYYGVLRYYENQGDDENPNFVLIGGPSNPFYGIYLAGDKDEDEQRLAPQFVDIDGDGDQDLFVGTDNDGVYLFLNQGDDENPSFNSTEDENYVGLSNIKLDFADVNGDELDDLVFGSKSGLVGFVPNSGSAPYFEAGDAEGLPANLPVGYVYANLFAAPQMVDIDFDGDLDLILGSDLPDRLRTFINTGDAYSPYFEELTGADNPLDGFVFPPNYLNPNPECGDLDGDGDIDFVVGLQDGTVMCIENTSPLIPIPTMTQWGIMILGLLVSIFGVLGLKEERIRKMMGKTTLMLLLISCFSMAGIAQSSSSGKIFSSDIIITDAAKFESSFGSVQTTQLMEQNGVSVLLQLEDTKRPNRRIINFEYQSDQGLKTFLEEMNFDNSASDYGFTRLSKVALSQIYSAEGNGNSDNYMVGYYKSDSPSSIMDKFDLSSVEQFGMKVVNISQNQKHQELIYILYEMEDGVERATTDEGMESSLSQSGLTPLFGGVFFGTKK